MHRSFAVSLDHILTIGADTVIMHSYKPVEIPVSKKYYQKLMDRILILEAGANGCGSECDGGDSEQVDEELREMGPDDERWGRFQGREEDEG